MEFSYKMEESIQMFYNTTGNYRELIKIFNSKTEPKEICDKSMMLYFFVNSRFYIDLEEKYKDISVDFYKYVLEYIYLLNNISEADLEVLVSKFLEINYDGVLHVSFLTKSCLSFIKEGFIPDGISKFGFSRYSEEQIMVVQILKEISIKKIHIFNNTTKKFEKDECTNFLKMWKERIYGFDNMQSLKVSDYKSFLTIWKEVYFHKIFKRDFHQELTTESRDITIINNSEHYSVENAIKKMKMYQIDKLIGLILIEPYDRINDDRDSKPLYNGYIITSNGFDIIALAYIGYPGLSSHKKYKFDDLIKFVKENKIPTIKIKNNESLMHIWDKCFSSKDKNLINSLLKESYLRDWIEKLMAISFYKENFYEEDVESIVK